MDIVMPIQASLPEPDSDGCNVMDAWGIHLHPQATIWNVPETDGRGNALDIEVDGVTDIDPLNGPAQVCHRRLHQQVVSVNTKGKPRNIKNPNYPL